MGWLSFGSGVLSLPPRLDLRRDRTASEDCNLRPSWCRTDPMPLWPNLPEFCHDPLVLLSCPPQSHGLRRAVRSLDLIRPPFAPQSLPAPSAIARRGPVLRKGFENKPIFAKLNSSFAPASRPEIKARLRRLTVDGNVVGQRSAQKGCGRSCSLRPYLLSHPSRWPIYDLSSYRKAPRVILPRGFSIVRQSAVCAPT